jgi:hypothetical protein
MNPKDIKGAARAMGGLSAEMVRWFDSDRIQAIVTVQPKDNWSANLFSDMPTCKLRQRRHVFCYEFLPLYMTRDFLSPH